MEALHFKPIGVIRTPYTDKYGAPRQPEVDERMDKAVVELAPHCNYEQSLDDLIGFERIWLLTWFDRATTWKPKVLTPRDRTKRGVFATRSPHRPNPIGLTCVRLIDVKGLCVYVEGTDLLDGTPVLDIKPYLPYADAFPDATAGWVDAIAGPIFDVVVPAAIEQRSPHVTAHIRRVLSLDPYPHPYRRTKLLDDGSYEIAMKQWRARYSINGNVVTVTDIVLQS